MIIHFENGQEFEVDKNMSIYNPNHEKEKKTMVTSLNMYNIQKMILQGKASIKK